MRMSAGVEWALHCAVLLSVLKPISTLTGRALAQFYGVSESYLLKHMQALTKAGVPLFAYGNFLTVLLNFIILAFIIFVMVKQVNRLKRDTPAAPAEPAAPPEDIQLLREIRDALRRDKA